MANSPLSKLIRFLLSLFRQANEPSSQETPPAPPNRPDKTTSSSTSSPPPTKKPPIAQSLLAEAERLLQTPYLYGGNDPQKGFDCSGLMVYVFGKAGISLPRTSSTQAEYGTEVSRSDLQPGDIVYFSHGGDRINHVGMVVSEAGEEITMIHASSSKGVIRTNIDRSSYWKPRLRGIRRVLH